MGVGCSAAVKILVVVRDASREECGGKEGEVVGVTCTHPDDDRVRTTGFNTVAALVELRPCRICLVAVRSHCGGRV